jgi:hypothetical protein
MYNEKTKVELQNENGIYLTYKVTHLKNGYFLNIFFFIILLFQPLYSQNSKYLKNNHNNYYS